LPAALRGNCANDLHRLGGTLVRASRSGGAHFNADVPESARVGEANGRINHSLGVCWVG